MNSKLIIVLGIISALLISVISFEYFYALDSRNQLLSSIAAVKTEGASDEMPALELDTETEESYTDLVDRPLFIKGRKPVAELPPESQQADTKGPPKTFDWQLSGVYTNAKGLTALVSRTSTKVPKDNFRRLSLDADLDGWKVSKIETGKVVLTQGAEEKELPLRKVKPKDAQNKSRPSPPQGTGPSGRPPQRPSIPPPAPVPEPEMPEPEPEAEIETDADDQPIDQESESETSDESIENSNNDHF